MPPSEVSGYKVLQTSQDVDLITCYPATIPKHLYILLLYTMPFLVNACSLHYLLQCSFGLYKHTGYFLCIDSRRKFVFFFVGGGGREVQIKVLVMPTVVRSSFSPLLGQSYLEVVGIA